ncbi:hypothetical protein ACXPWS_04545 [Mycobacterium sp. BMJ-28]
MSDTDITDDTEDRADDTAVLDPATAEKLDKLRREARNLRDRAQAAEARVTELETVQSRADELARALFTARVAATGKVQNPAEVPFDADLVDDSDALAAAIDAAITERPYIKARNLSGDAGQGERGNTTGPKDFSGLFR